MNKTKSAIITTACIGAAMGAAAYMVSDSRDVRAKTRRIKRTAGKTLRQVGDFIGNVSYMIK